MKLLVIEGIPNNGLDRRLSQTFETIRPPYETKKIARKSRALTQVRHSLETWLILPSSLLKCYSHPNRIPRKNLLCNTFTWPTLFHVLSQDQKTLKKQSASKIKIKQTEEYEKYRSWIKSLSNFDKTENQVDLIPDLFEQKYLIVLLM